MKPPLPLSALQRWMLEVITHPAGVEAGADEAAGTSTGVGLGDIVLKSRQQSPAERMSIYSTAYLARLLEVLRELFPCLRFAVGEELFAEFGRKYLAAHPPASYTLHRLADRFAEFLEATRPPEQPAMAFVVDLARLEHAIDQVFDGPGPEGIEPNHVASAFRANRLMLIPGFRLLAFRFPVSRYFTAWKSGGAPRWPDAEDEYIALARRDYVVRRYELSAVQRRLLMRLATGETLADSLAAIAGGVSNVDDLAAEVQRWFTLWSAEGFFYAGPAPSSAAMDGGVHSST